MRIIRVTRPEAFQRPELRTILLEAYEGVHKNPEASINKLAASIGNPNIALWVGLEAGEIKGVFMVVLPLDPVTDWVTWDTVVNKGSRALSEAGVRIAIDFCKRAGYDKALMLNNSGKPDHVYARLLRLRGIKATTRTSLMRLEF